MAVCPQSLHNWEVCREYLAVKIRSRTYLSAPPARFRRACQLPGAARLDVPRLTALVTAMQSVKDNVLALVLGSDLLKPVRIIQSFSALGFLSFHSMLLSLQTRYSADGWEGVASPARPAEMSSTIGAAALFRRASSSWPNVSFETYILRGFEFDPYSVLGTVIGELTLRSRGHLDGCNCAFCLCQSRYTFDLRHDCGQIAPPQHPSLPSNVINVDHGS
jgi:hypothetical protein